MDEQLPADYDHTPEFDKGGAAALRLAAVSFVEVCSPFEIFMPLRVAAILIDMADTIDKHQRMAAERN